MVPKPCLSVLVLLLAGCAADPQLGLSIMELPALPASAFAPGEDELSPDELRADLEALYEGMQDAHYDLYARQSKDAYDALYAELWAALDAPLKPSEAVFIFQRFAAFGNIGHARLDGPSEVWQRYRSAGGKAIPLYPRTRDERVFVAESYAPDVRPGDEIIAINGKPMSVWLPRLYRNTSADSDYLHATVLELSFPADLWAELGAVDAVQLTLKGEDGAVRTADVETISEETLDERSAIATSDVFVLDSSGRKSAMLEGGIAYLQPGPFYGVETPDTMWDPTAFWAFIDESFETFLAADAAALIIDIRQNPGGDSSFSDRMIAWFADEPFRFASQFLIRSSAQSEASNQARIDANPAIAAGPSGDFARLYAETPYGESFSYDIPFSRPRDGKRFEGPVYAIVDRYSYSNTTSVAALLQDYGFATLLGEETSDLPTSYGAMETFTLPHSGLVVGYPKAYLIRPSGDESVRGVVPDIPIDAPVFSTRDEMLDAVIDHVRQEQGLE
ncbi:MAG: S41 family peptidase [Pseudomonadota bacterium]